MKSVRNDLLVDMLSYHCLIDSLKLFIAKYIF
jgi:hypothetical protein